MTNIGLDRPHTHRATLPRREDLTQRPRLDRVADLGAGPVCLDVVNLMAIHPRAGHRPPDDVHLAGDRRHGQPGSAVPGVADRAAADDRVDSISVVQGSLHRLQQNEATAVAWYVAVGTFIECVGMAGRRYRAEFLFQHGCFACQVEVNTTGNRQRRFACSHAFACQMHRYQG
ncbi:Uncharacterised protein [Mycobacterium tuberculosis]|uniref:Uncharacterized protein n=1 Tax=Mycobacterium tuberculosis TaxID=1773 RepID=A0A0T7LCC9_MYCTX|nr:Uncharacterised protein [Mycobacterium tuberculosis]CKQ21774.1 Uncharacterised protein [Mycobacterium tuberculosis]CKR31989.1 Uncharacterised protein [Mycobacterium tuberculosis]CKR91468.1 Uncharacterised protein [Mycobacterium tuberculosis]CKS76803.1 Uncharacterised protein [Mycobacterium tuberculosis]